MVTQTDRRLGTNVLVQVVNLWQTIPQDIVNSQRGIQEAYNAYIEYLNVRLNMVRDREWMVNLSIEQHGETEDRWLNQPFFQIKPGDTQRKFIPADELKSYDRIVICGLWLKEQVLDEFLKIKKVNVNTFIAPTLCFPQKWGYDKHVEKHFHQRVLANDYMYL